MNDLHPDLVRILVPEETIQAHVKVLAHQISQDYADKHRTLPYIAELKESVYS